ncbi:hypothetical protein GCM10010252_37820 [Streptomyces aureoverticillatus]|nr:hypothetical protein GCM10010252_37820 [Streptomyces aureoverticillatus]
MLGVGGTRSKLSRKALRGGRDGGRVGGGLSPQEQKRELLRKLQEERSRSEEGRSPNTGEDRSRNDGS